VDKLEWVHYAIGIISAAVGAAAGIFSGGWRLGRIEGRLKLNFQEAITMSEQRIEQKLEEARTSFDETLKGLRQKINDVELDTVKTFVAKGDFDDFRQEYREDMRDLKKSIEGLSRKH
jgi:hypothetical protein